MENSNQPVKINSAKFAFYYLLSLITLCFTALSTGQILFQIINKNLPDINGQYGTDFSQDVLKFAIAAIIIATPIFFIVSRLIYKDLNSGKLAKDAGIRRWLSYFILLVSSVLIIVYLIVTILGFLNGELTAQFILKVLTVVGISGMTFSFYLYDIRRQIIDKKDKVVKIYTYVAVVIVLVAFASSLFIVESPQKTRNRRIDDQTVNNFSAIDNNVNSYYAQNAHLPENLEALKSSIGFSENIYTNQITNETYSYEIIATSSYKLCANFKTSNLDKTQSEYRYIDDRLRHDTGYQCLPFKIYNFPQGSANPVGTVPAVKK
ncbi:MAG: DUF5671 domain-containing protein [Candidatus Falkowbacteria bacterium]